MTDCRLPNDSRGAAPHVLVVDDESYVRGLLLRWLTEAGCTCDEARDPDEAFDRLRRRRTDLVTLDIRMPLGSGLDAVHKIAKEFPDTAIVIVSAANDTQHAISALTSGACDYLIKPVEREMFLWRMRRALAMRQRRRDFKSRNAAPGPRPVFLAQTSNASAAARKREHDDAFVSSGEGKA